MAIKDEDMNKINQIVQDLHLIICKKNLESFKDIIRTLHTIENKELLQSSFKYSGTEIICLICRHNRKKHLNYILHEAHILHYLSGENKNTDMEFKEDALYYAMCSNNFEILEMLYDYWSGDLHWLGHKKEYNKTDVENLTLLNVLLKKAFDRYKDFIKVKNKLNPQNIFNIESLTAFNEFQRELYNKLIEIKANLRWNTEIEDNIRIQETYAIKDMILSMFDIYEKHSMKEQSLLENSFIEINDKIAEGLSDTTTLIHKIRLFIMFEIFYRKLDYNFCLLILDNLHLLKLRLSMTEGSYQKIENKLYYFIYHISTNWNLYSPRKKRMRPIKLLGYSKGRIYLFSNNQDVNKAENIYNIIYLERRDFERTMKIFKEELQNRNIEENTRKTRIKLPNEDNNCLMLLPHLRDDYSLKVISQHISHLHSVDIKCEKRYAFLLVERTLQVLGEFLKCTDESLHMQQTTEALIKAETSVEIINDLKTLRNILCHAKNGELLKRIEAEENSIDMFDSIVKELLYIKKKIDVVIEMHKPIVERDLLQNSLSIINKRKYEMPQEVDKVFFYVLKTINHMPDFIRGGVQKNFFAERWAPHQYSKSLMEEVSVLAQHATKLESKYVTAIKKIHNRIKRKIPFYLQRIKESIKKITFYIEQWKEIKRILKEKNSSINLLDYPNEEDANRIKLYSNKLFNKGDFLTQYTNVNELFAHVLHHWNFIENLLQFIVHKTRIFNDTIEELKFSLFSHKLQEISNNSFKSNDMKGNVLSYLNMIEQKVNSMVQRKNNKLFEDSNTKMEIPEFVGIQKFTNKLTIGNFLTQEEKRDLIATLNKIYIKNDTKKRYFIQLMINKITTDTPMSRTEYNNFIKSIKMESKFEKVLMNLVMGYKRSPLLPLCFSKRVSLLHELTQHQTINQLVLRYKLDKTFRVLLEVLLFDMFIILEQNKDNDVMKKSSKLLTEMNLRNVLTHGSPLLEVVGNILDSNDLPTELITKALDFVHDKKSIDALFALSDLDLDFTEMNTLELKPESKTLIEELKSSSRWKDYMLLLPDYKKNIYVKHKRIPDSDEKSIALSKAVIKKDAQLVQESIDNGGNVNFIDSHDKATFHYAAMKGSVEILKVLLKNGANVNIRSKHSHLTALHYSSMNNFLDTVVFLLENDAQCHALDDKGKTPVYWACQRNHVKVSRVLVKAMKKCNCYVNQESE